MKSRLFTLLLSVAAVAAMVGCKEKPKGAEEPKEKVEVAFHVMSQCPFGVQVEKGIKPVLDQLGKAVDFKLIFIGDEKDGKMTSMHGDNEIKGDLLQLCAMKLAPDTFMNVIECMNKNVKEIPNNFDACATEAKIDGAKVKACADGDEGQKLLADSFKVSKEKQARGSPTIFVGGEKYSGGRQPNDFLRAICGKYKEKPEACKNIPEPKKLALTVLSDARCKDCMPDRIVNQLKNMFPGLTPKTVDYGTPEGKQLYDSLKDKGVKLLPAFLMEPAVTEDPGFDQVKRFVTDAGPYKLLQIGAKFDPTAEICDNKADDDGNGKVDCDDETCKSKMVCRPEIKGQLEVFVMSQCPFGVKALNAMKEVLAAFDKKIDFKVNFIGGGDAKSGLTGMHGQAEVDENIREICAIKHYPKDYKWMEYVLCRNKDIRSTKWEECAKGDIKADVIKKCFEGDEGKQLLEASYKYSQGLGFGASPTWLANNKYKFSGIDPETIKKNLCDHNKELKGCENKLSGNSGAPVQGGCGN